MTYPPDSDETFYWRAVEKVTDFFVFQLIINPGDALILWEQLSGGCLEEIDDLFEIGEFCRIARGSEFGNLFHDIMKEYTPREEDPEERRNELERHLENSLNPYLSYSVLAELLIQGLGVYEFGVFVEEYDVSVTATDERKALLTKIVGLDAKVVERAAVAHEQRTPNVC